MLDNLQHTFPRLAKWCQPCSATLAQQREHTHAHICTIEGQDIKQQQQQQPNRLANCHTRDACAAVQLSQASMIVFRCGCTSHHLLWHACYLCLLAIRTVAYWQQQRCLLCNAYDSQAGYCRQPAALQEELPACAFSKMAVVTSSTTAAATP
jgi:hypothetical protein